MRAVIQRVSYASVTVEGEVVGKINKGFLVLLGITHSDGEKEIKWLAKKITDLRVFNDSEEKMNLGLREVGGELLVISQFTLFGDCIKGRRPSFTESAKGEVAKPIYLKFLEECKSLGVHTEAGIFGADMKVELLNDGPVTLIIDTKDCPKL